MTITTLGIDIAKSVFQLHGVDADGVVCLQKKLRRGAVLNFLSKLEPCLIGMEACATSHHWAREIAALGHDVRLIPPAYVKPYVKRQKNDAADAEAICEAVTRPNMRFVPVKTEEQQGVLVLHRSRDLLMRQRTMILNAIRAHMAEFGVIAAQGPCKVTELVRRLQEDQDPELPELARAGLLALAAQLENLQSEVRTIERQLLAWHRQSAASRRLETIPGVGIITATALAASVPDPTVFKSGRQFAAWLGLVPRQNSSGGKDRLGRISKMGTLIKALARAFRWKRMLESGEFTTIAELAQREGIAPSYMTRVLRLTLLAPDIVEAILDGKQGTEVTLARALEPFPVEWSNQRTGEACYPDPESVP